MDHEVAMHFRDELREARAVALRDSEAFEQVVFVMERLGVYLTGSVENLSAYANAIAEEARGSPLANEIPSCLPDWHAPFPALYALVRSARNDALHEGAFARHLTSHAVELALILEEALMEDAFGARDYMVRDPVCAFWWQPISSVRRSMLVNSFSFLPIVEEKAGQLRWKLLSDFALASYLRSARSANERKKLLARPLREVVDSGAIALPDAPVCEPQDSVVTVLARSGGLPVLVMGPDGGL